METTSNMNQNPAEYNRNVTAYIPNMLLQLKVFFFALRIERRTKTSKPIEKYVQHNSLELYYLLITCPTHTVNVLNRSLLSPNSINILGTGPRMNPFNNKVYNGICDRVKEPSTLSYNRLPWNVAVINYEVHSF